MPGVKSFIFGLVFCSTTFALPVPADGGVNDKRQIDSLLGNLGGAAGRRAGGGADGFISIGPDGIQLGGNAGGGASGRGRRRKGRLA